MMKISQLLIIAAVSTATTGEPHTKGAILTSSQKTVFPTPSKVSFGSFQTFGAAFSSPDTPAATLVNIPPTIHSFHQHAGGSYSGSVESHARTDDSFSRTGDSFLHGENPTATADSFPQTSNIPPIGENFLRINQNSRTSQSFAQNGQSFAQKSQSFSQKGHSFSRTGQNVAAVDRRQGIPATAPFSFGPQSNRLEDLLEQEWNTFKTTFNKTYSSFEEERQRREIFIENRNKVARFNQEYGNGRHSFVQKLNRYADLLNHEFNNQVNGFNRTRKDNGGVEPERRSSSYIPSANVALPTYVDWREAGAVSSVKSQGTCGACYAFAATGALEGQNFRRTGHLVELSTQNLIDCTDSYSNNGCTGGLMEYAFDYIRDNRGIDTEGAYPYEERDGLQCRYRQDGYGAHDTGYVLLDEGDERGLEAAVATMGPVAIAFDAHPESFQFYSTGIYFEPQCSSAPEQLNHALLVVGYGTEPDGQQYWLLKNSYGPEWGIGGYMKLAKYSNNMCGVATYATYPLV